MSDKWSHYVADMEGKQASVVFDDGISQTIRSLPETTAIFITIDLQETNEFDMPTTPEADRLESLQDKLQLAIDGVEGYNVGRITSNGKRYLFFYAREMPESLSASLLSVAGTAGYTIKVQSRDDPEKSDYFVDLYPDPESRQVVNDISLISLLGERGDNLTKPRLVDHLTILPTKQAAEQFSEWAKRTGYTVDQIRKEGPLFKKSFHVETHNVTAVTVWDINPHSLGHHRKAVELGGYYDGWATIIVPHIEDAK